MITITVVSNPVYSKADNSTIDVLLTTDEMGQIPYTAGATDPMPYGQKLWADLNNGVHGTIGVYVAPVSNS